METNKLIHIEESPFGEKGKQVVGVITHPASDEIFIAYEGFYNSDKSCLICNHSSHGKSVEEAVSNVVYVARKYYSGEWEETIEMNEDRMMLLGA